MRRNGMIGWSTAIGLMAFLALAGCRDSVTEELAARSRAAEVRTQELEVMLVEMREHTRELQAQNREALAEVLADTGRIKASINTLIGRGLTINMNASKTVPRGGFTDVGIGDAPSMGKEDARIEVVEFGDFQCPFCMRAEGFLAELVEEYPDDVRVGYRHYPIGSRHPMAPAAARASWAAHQQGKFWEMYELIFASRGKLDDGVLREHARTVGLDMKKFDEDRKAQRSKKAVYTDRRLGKASGVRGTPSFFVDGILIGGSPEQVRAKIGEKLGAKGAPGED